MIQSDPKRQSQLLMQSKRRSLAIKDTDLLEQMLRGDLEGFGAREEDEEEEEEDYEDHIEYVPSDKEEEEEQEHVEEPVEEKRSVRVPEPLPTLSEPKPTTTTATCLTCSGLPCTFPCSHSTNTSKPTDPFAFVTGITIILSFASQFGITDDWTVPITLATLVSSFLWNGNKKNKKKAL